MTASTKPKTPNMTLPILSHADKNAIDELCKRASRVTLSQVVETVLVKERIRLKHGARTKEYIVNICFYPAADYQKEYLVTTAEILSCFGIRFARMLRKEIALELKRLEADLKTQSAKIGEGRTERGSGASGEDAENEPESQAANNTDDDSEVGDGDAEDAKRHRQSKQQATYDDDSDDDAANPDPIVLDNEGIEAAFRDEDPDDEMQSDHDGRSPDGEEDELTALVQEVEELFMKNLKNARTFTFDESGCSFDLEVCTFISRCICDATEVAVVWIRLAEAASGGRCGTDMQKDSHPRDPRYQRLLPCPQ